MNAQLTLPLKERKARMKRGPKLAARMIAALAVNGSWMTRRQFHERHGFSSDGRECRLGRKCSRGRIIFGQQGFKLLRYATPAEIRQCSNIFIGEIQVLQDEHRQLTKRAHTALARKET